MVTLYLDACALNRLLDDQRQPRIRREAEAVENIFGLISRRQIRWIGGDILRAEVRQNPSWQKREDALALLELADEHPALSPAIAVRANALEQAGYGAFDALHLATAEASGADVLLTTDDRFLRQVRRGLGNPAVPVLNPINWLRDWKP